MRNKESKNYDRTDKASGHSLGSHLLHFLLVSGCFISGAAVFCCLFFYFFPDQAIHSALVTRKHVEHLKQIIIMFPERTHPFPDIPSPQEIQQKARSRAVASVSDAVSAGIVPPEMFPSPEPPAPERTDPEIPLITFSSALGSSDNLDLSEEGSFLDEDYLVMLDSAMGPMLYYNQGDSRWGDYLYGGADAMSQYGCGPTVTAMLINAFTEHRVIPPNLADWAAANGCYSLHGGSRHKIIQSALSAYGLKVESAAGADYDTAAELLRSGHVLVALMGRGIFSSDGHFVVITNILENGNVHIADCYNFENTKLEWDLNLLLSELKHSSDDGSPLWAVTYPDE